MFVVAPLHFTIWIKSKNRSNQKLIPCPFPSFHPAVQCPGGQVYQECGHTCGRSCSDLRQGWSCDDGGAGIGHRVCVPGCQCPVELVQDHQGQCVPITLCSCVQGDKMYSPGAVVQNNCKTWYVKNIKNCEGDMFMFKSKSFLQLHYYSTKFHSLHIYSNL